MDDESPVPTERISGSIVLIRGQKVLLDKDLTALYGVVTKVLNQAVRRNLERFPHDFMFQLTTEEAARLRSQIVTLDADANLVRKLEALERRYDSQFKVVFDAIRDLMAQPSPARKRIGFDGATGGPPSSRRA